MEVLKGACIYHLNTCAKYIGISAPVFTHNITKTLCVQSEGWGYKHRCKSILQVGVQFGGISPQPYCKKQWRVHCSFISSSDGNGSMAGNFNANDEDYVNSTVIEAVQMPSLLLMASILNVPIEGSTIYQVAKVMIEELGLEVQVVRITKRVDQVYFAQLHLSKVRNVTEIYSFDLRPSDAINLAVQCKVPIQVNRHLAYCDGMRVVGSSKFTKNPRSSDGKLSVNLDRPDSEPCSETKEFAFVRNMLTAAFEERYEDAAMWRDQLRLFRKNMN